MFTRHITLCLLTCITDNIQVTEGCKQFPEGPHVCWPWSNGARNVYSLECEDYANDICLLTHSTRTMQKMLERLGKESAKTGLKINVKKTKEMRIAMTNKEPLYIHNEIIERVTQFTYLGSITDNTGGTEADIKARIRKAQAAFSVLNKIWRSTTYSTQSKLASSTRT